ncbi:hypothetical protein R1flu_008447 [Riccia fluitans]|uniref:Maleylacetoacetate isomerase n=1 Tax=Riccia fluitans TaxID=41844 RepID=A0ABD1YEU3_9MARC
MILSEQRISARQKLEDMAEPGKEDGGKADFERIVFHSFCHSSCSWRIRLALGLKGIPFELKTWNLSAGEHLSEEFKQVSPLQMVPALEVDGDVLVDSLAIMEYLEEMFPEKPLLPSDRKKRAAVRGVVNIIASAIQPLQNLRVLQGIQKLGGPEARLEWAQQWIANGFTALESILAKTSGKYCFGDEITLADVVLIPQMNNADRHKVDLSPFPTLVRIRDGLYELELVQNSAPEKQPDFTKPTETDVVETRMVLHRAGKDHDEISQSEDDDCLEMQPHEPQSGNSHSSRTEHTKEAKKHFDRYVIDSGDSKHKEMARCKYCHREFVYNSTRMSQHLLGAKDSRNYVQTKACGAAPVDVVENLRRLTPGKFSSIRRPQKYQRVAVVDETAERSLFSKQEREEIVRLVQLQLRQEQVVEIVESKSA